MLVDPFIAIERLAAAGDLRFISVIGVTRSNSTLVCRLLGRALDGAVYEPAVPASRVTDEHFAEVILRAVRKVRKARGDTQPVILAIKDLSLFLTPRMLAFIERHAEHVVFTIRAPRSQQASLVKQFRQEFSIGQRIDALLRDPMETGWFLWHAFGLAPRFARLAKSVEGGSWRRSPQLTVAGWNIESWQKIAAQHRRLSQTPGRVTIMDAGEMRRDPDGAMATLSAIAARVRAPGTPSSLEIPAHTRMKPRSAWAKEALRSDAIRPSDEKPGPPPAADPYDERLFAAIEPIYAELMATAYPAAARAPALAS